MVRIDSTAEDSLAAMRARSRFGMAMAAIIRMIATTINNSISEKPFCFCIGSLGFMETEVRWMPSLGCLAFTAVRSASDQSVTFRAQQGAPCILAFSQAGL